MYLLIDECCGKALVRVAEAAGHTAQRTRDIGQLGQGATDRDIFDFACRNGAVIVTSNHRDFEALAAEQAHPGMIFVPQTLGSELARLFRDVLPTAEQVIASGSGQIVEIEEDGRIVSFS
jgi:predicted nuclease of predicted toxin-antitoxin system